MNKSPTSAMPSTLRDAFGDVPSLFILILIGVVAFSIRLFSVIKYESVIHESDPYFNYRATQMDPAYRSSNSKDGSGALPFAGSDLVLSPSQWSGHVVGKISTWIDLDSVDEILRKDSEIALKQEVAWASHLSVQACLLPAPKGSSHANYARCVNQILQNLTNMQLWLRIPLEKSDDDSICGSSDHMIVISGKPVHNSRSETVASNSTNVINRDEDISCHPLRSYLDYIAYLYQRMDPLPEQERFELGYRDYLQSPLQLGYRDYLQSPLQPLMDNLEAQTYETFEKDTVKYVQGGDSNCKSNTSLLSVVCSDGVICVADGRLTLAVGKKPVKSKLLDDEYLKTFWIDDYLSISFCGTTCVVEYIKSELSKTDLLSLPLDQRIPYVVKQISELSLAEVQKEYLRLKRNSRRQRKNLSTKARNKAIGKLRRRSEEWGLVGAVFAGVPPGCYPGRPNSYNFFFYVSGTGY